MHFDRAAKCPELSDHVGVRPKRLANADFDDFVRCYRERKETERFRYEKLAQRYKLNLDIFWLKDDSLEDIDSLAKPDVLSAEIVENLEPALAGSGLSERCGSSPNGIYSIADHDNVLVERQFPRPVSSHAVANAFPCPHEMNGHYLAQTIAIASFQRGSHLFVFGYGIGPVLGFAIADEPDPL